VRVCVCVQAIREAKSNMNLHSSCAVTVCIGSHCGHVCRCAVAVGVSSQL